MLINTHYPNCLGTAHLIVDEVVRADCYRVRGLRQAPEVVFDVGANIGVFAVLARMLWPRAQVIALEPVPETRAVLSQNVAQLGIEVWPVGLGDGRPAAIARDPRSDGGNRLVAGTTVDLVETMTLAKLVEFSFPASYLLKLDCEGAERHVVDNPQNEAALAGALHWAMEYHENWAGKPAADFLAALERADKRTCGQHYRGHDWLIWSGGQ